MVHQHLAKAPRRRRTRPRGGRSRSYPLGRWTGQYLIGLGLLTLSLAAGPGAVLFAWPAIGWWLSRSLDRGIMWIHHSGSIDNLARAKFGLILRWPLELPRFIITVWFVRNA